MTEDRLTKTASEEEPSFLTQIHISVRGLVEFVLRHGDIDNRHGSSGGAEVMLEGANIHRMIQRRMGSNYHSEYYLRLVTRRKDYEIVIDGRADGIIIPTEWEEYVSDENEAYTYLEDFENGDGAQNELNDDDENALLSSACGENNDEDEKLAKEASLIADSIADIVREPSAGRKAGYEREALDGLEMPSRSIIIDEIKTTMRDLDRIKEPEPVHLAQAKCYAYFFALINELPVITVRLTYCNSETFETRYFESEFSFAEIKSWFEGLMKLYVRWADYEVAWKKIRNASIEKLTFPFPYRDGQRELIAQVYRSVENRERLFVMAPTGVGKTIANVYPSLKAIALGRAEKIFYLTAKTITRQVASDCLDLLRKDALRFKSVTLTAKEKICPEEEMECNPDKCPYACGHYDRINDAMYDLLLNEDDFSREKILEYAQKHMVCPFEFTLDMSLFSDMVICDYNYVFDPNVYLRRFFGEGGDGKYLFLVDEAHNLVDRAMSMYSAKLVKESFLDIKKLVKDVDPKLAKAVEACNRTMLSYKRECTEEVKVYDTFEPFVMQLLKLTSRIEQFLDEFDHFEHNDEILEFYFEVRHFLNMYETMDEDDYVMYSKHNENNEFVMNLMCADPGHRVRMCTDKALATVFFSATLLPIAYYRQMLGASDTDPAVYAQSVFDPRRRALVVARDVTSKYKRRNDAEYDRMAEYISEITNSKSGNYMVFCPSFAVMGRVYEMFEDHYRNMETCEVIIQTQSMGERDREEFLGYFTGTRDKTLVGFCVLGGIFSEGIDLRNDALIGAIIIGTGLPMVCSERDLLKYRYEDNGLDGFAYAYRYPGMNKVEQAAGRVIRTAEDTGVVALLDERFLDREYMRLFPREWDNYSVCRVDDVGEYLEEFWNTVK